MIYEDIYATIGQLCKIQTKGRKTEKNGDQIEDVF